VFENSVLRRLFGPKRDEVTGEWRKLHNEELYDLYASLNIVRVIKSSRMRRVGHVARMRYARGMSRALVEKGHSGDQGVDGRIILNDWIEPAQNRDRLRILVNMVITLRVP
jgi:hypothetical protein